MPDTHHIDEKELREIIADWFVRRQSIRPTKIVLMNEGREGRHVLGNDRIRTQSTDERSHNRKVILTRKEPHMGPAQRKAFEAQLKKTATDPATSQADKDAISKLLHPGVLHRAALRLVELHAGHAIRVEAENSGMKAADLDAADAETDAAALPPGWLQALLAALPAILAFAQAIAKIFGL